MSSSVKDTIYNFSKQTLSVTDTDNTKNSFKSDSNILVDTLASPLKKFSVQNRCPMNNLKPLKSCKISVVKLEDVRSWVSDLEITRKTRRPFHVFLTLTEGKFSVKKKVTETARVWSASAGVSSILGNNQHQRLMGSSGEELGATSPTTPSTYQSSPNLLEKGREKGANFFGGFDGGYQRLENQNAVRKNSWGENWESDWGNQEKNFSSLNNEEAKKEINLNSLKEQTKQTRSMTSNRSSMKENKKDHEDLLLDFDSPSSNDSKKKTGAGPGPTSSDGGVGHTWDNWDDDNWEKIQ